MTIAGIARAHPLGRGSKSRHVRVEAEDSDPTPERFWSN